MGCVCCCLRDANLEDQEHRAGSCIGLHHLTRLFEDVYHSLFERRERVAPSDQQETSPLPATSSLQANARVDTNHLLPSHLSNKDPRGSQPQSQDAGILLGHAKGPRVLHEKSVSFRCENAKHTTLVCIKRSIDSSEDEVGSKRCNSESSLKQPSAEMTYGVTYPFPVSEDEDVCPICLEEYTSENPRSHLQCSHQFHLSCIYEWMERSHACPFCSKNLEHIDTPQGL